MKQTKTNASGRKIVQLEKVVFANCMRPILNLVNLLSTPRLRIKSISVSSTVSLCQVNVKRIMKPATSL